MPVPYHRVSILFHLYNAVKWLTILFESLTPFVKPHRCVIEKA